MTGSGASCSPARADACNPAQASLQWCKASPAVSSVAGDGAVRTGRGYRASRRVVRSNSHEARNNRLYRYALYLPGVENGYREMEGTEISTRVDNRRGRSPGSSASLPCHST